MQSSLTSSHHSSPHRGQELPPNGKRAIAIKWTDEEWGDIAAAMYLDHADLLKDGSSDGIKARHVFNAQTCLPRARQRQLISIAQDFSIKRQKILQIFEHMRQGTGTSGMTLRPATNERPASTSEPAIASDAQVAAAVPTAPRVFRRDRKTSAFTSIAEQPPQTAFGSDDVADPEHFRRHHASRRLLTVQKAIQEKSTKDKFAQRPEVASAIEAIFGPAPGEVKDQPTNAVESTHDAAPVASEVISAIDEASCKRGYFRWTALEWNEVAAALYRAKGASFNEDHLLNVAASDVFAAQSVLAPDRHRTLASLFSGFASTQKRLSLLVASLSRVSDPTYVDAESIAHEPGMQEAPLTPPHVSKQSTEAQPAVVEHRAAEEPADLADIVRHLTPEPDASDSSAAPVKPGVSPVSEAVRPFMRMVFEEFWRAASKHAIPHIATFLADNKKP